MFFNNIKPSYENFYDGDVFVVPTEEGVNQIYLEGVQELSSILGAMHVADVAVNETAIYRGEQEARSLMESSVASVFGRIKEFIVNLIKKIKEWFKKMVENLKIFFMGADKFIAQYGSGLTSKSVKGFIHRGHDAKYDEIAKYRALVQKATTTTIESIMQEVDKCKSAEDVKTYEANADSDDEKEEREHEDALNKIKEAYGRDVESAEIDEFSRGLKVSQMIEVIKNSKKLISDINNAGATYESTLKGVISKVEKKEKDYEKDDKKSYLAPACRKAVSTTNKVISRNMAAVSAIVSNEKALYRECLITLKKFAMYRGEKVDKNSTTVGFIDNFSL